MESKKRPNPAWVVVASHEFMKILKHLGMRSINEASRQLRINYRTLRKLASDKPDPTLTLEKMMMIWHSFHAYAVYIQSPDRAREEAQFIADSLARIMQAFPIPDGLQEDVIASVQKSSAQHYPNR